MEEGDGEIKGLRNVLLRSPGCLLTWGGGRHINLPALSQAPWCPCAALWVLWMCLCQRLEKDDTEAHGLFPCDNLDTGLLFGRGWCRGRVLTSSGKKLRLVVKFALWKVTVWEFTLKEPSTKMLKLQRWTRYSRAQFPYSLWVYRYMKIFFMYIYMRCFPKPTGKLESVRHSHNWKHKFKECRL